MSVTSVAALLVDPPQAEVDEQRPVRDACVLMSDLDVGALAVLRDGRLTGVVSERDVVRRCIAAGLAPGATTVADIMTPAPRTIAASGTLAEALDIMIGGGFHHIPVLDGERLLGLLSIDQIPEEYRMLLERFRELRNP